MEITGKIVNVLPTLSGQGKNGEWVKNSYNAAQITYSIEDNEIKI